MTNEQIENELKCPKCLVSHCEHCKCDKCNNTDKPMELREVVFEGTPVVFTPLDSKGKHPELVVVDVQDLIEASKRHREALKQAIQATREETVEEIRTLLINHGGLMPEPMEKADSDWNKAVRAVDGIHKTILDSLTNK